MNFVACLIERKSKWLLSCKNIFEINWNRRKDKKDVVCRHWQPTRYSAKYCNFQERHIKSTILKLYSFIVTVNNLTSSAQFALTSRALYWICEVQYKKVNVLVINSEFYVQYSFNNCWNSMFPLFVFTVLFVCCSNVCFDVICYMSVLPLLLF